MGEEEMYPMRECCETRQGAIHTDYCPNKWRPAQGVATGANLHHGMPEEPRSSAGWVPSEDPAQFITDDTPEYTRRGVGVYHYDLCLALCIDEKRAEELLAGLKLVRMAQDLIRE